MSANDRKGKPQKSSKDLEESYDCSHSLFSPLS